MSHLQELIRELKQRRRRRRLVKHEFIFYKRNSRLSRSPRYANGSKNVKYETNMKQRRSFQIEIRKIGPRGPLFVDDAELGHFTLSLC